MNELLEYNKETGVFTWKSSRPKCKIGSIAGTTSKHHGYVTIGIDNKLYRAHRLAWLIVTGSLPSGQIDHKNRIRTDNRFCNLSDVSGFENQKNKSLYSSNTSGFVGVNWHRSSGKWHVRAQSMGRRVFIGEFSDLDAAIAARRAASGSFGFSESHGSKTVFDNALEVHHNVASALAE